MLTPGNLSSVRLQRNENKRLVNYSSNHTPILPVGTGAIDYFNMGQQTYRSYQAQ